MSVRVMTTVWESAVPAPERFTLLALADAADDGGLCWPSVRTLAKKVRVHEATVQRHLTTLAERGWLSREFRTGSSTRYRIAVSELPMDDPEPPADRGPSEPADPPADCDPLDPPEPPADCYPPQIATPRKSRPNPPTDCGGTPLQIAAQNRKEPSGNQNPPYPPAAAEGASDGTLALDLPEPEPARPAKPDLEAGFDEFWATWPRKIAKPKAREKYRAAIRGGATPEHIRTAAERQVAGWRAERKETRYIPHPATWLHHGRYDDEVPAAKSHLRVISNPDSPWDGYVIDDRPNVCEGWA